MKRLILFILLLNLASCSRFPISKHLHRSIAQDTATMQVIDPLRAIEKIEVPYNTETVHHLSNARIVLADYDLIRRDFPHTRALSESQIDQWLLDNSAFMSEHQIKQTRANNSIPIDNVTRTANRPKDYGRALVFTASEEATQSPVGLIDAKGVGSLRPSPGGHSDGLMTLGESIREFVYEKMVNRVFSHEGDELKTVGSYAVIDGGFDVVHADGSTSPAGIYLRQAHVRNKGTYSLMSESDSLRIEKVLRKYGITSAGAYRYDYNYDKINIQGTSKNEVLDFGGFLVVDKFQEREAKHFYGSNVLIKKSQVTQADPHLRIPFDVWGTTLSGKEDPKDDNIWRWSHELADSWRKGNADRQAATQHFHNLIGPVDARLPIRAGKFTGSCNAIMLQFLD